MKIENLKQSKQVVDWYENNNNNNKLELYYVVIITRS